MRQYNKNKKTSKLLIAILIILPVFLLLVQIKVTKVSALDTQDITAGELHNQPVTVSSRNRQDMLHPAVKLSILDYNSALSGIQSSEAMVSGSATGVSIGYDRRLDLSYILTNYHFCEDVITGQFKVIMVEDSSTPRVSGVYEDSEIGSVIRASPELDLCLITVSEYIKPARMANKNVRVNAFDKIYIVGAPTGIFPTILDTYVSGYLPRNEVTLPNLSNSPEANEFLFISGIILPGHSGSPVYNNNNELIGLVFATIPSYGALAISIKDIYYFLENQ